MDTNLIAEICNNSFLGQEHKETLILEILAKDECVIPYILNILGKERKESREKFLDAREVLEQSFVYMQNIPQKQKGIKRFAGLTANFVMGKIQKWFVNHKVKNSLLIDELDYQKVKLENEEKNF